MKSIVFSFSLMFVLAGAFGQAKLTPGSKFTLTQESKINTTTSMMGTDMLIESTNTLYVEIEIKTLVNDSTLVINGTVKRITGHFSVMGQDQNFDSDDKSTATSPQLAPLLKNLNKQEEFTIINGKIKGTGNQMDDAMGAVAQALTGGGGASASGFVGQLFVPLAAKNKNLGDKWTTDEKSSDGNMKMVSIFTITKLTGDEIEITANVGTSFVGSIHVMEMDMKQNMSGITTSVFTYNQKTGVLKAGNSTISSNGTAEVMGNSLPMNIKGTTTVSVQ
ncbi:hypothetical protein [Parasediminibacterium sp. JCM 36343]|uniref:hypothetical protein n=1 Tax=Parasediminibacterium sp. JCM 36343 TaxID=3374279 RepID=UPI00397AC2EE